MVTHSKLLDCLPTLGVGERIIAWIKAFLENRSFRVQVNDALSSPAGATSGCPQGTVLGSVCYILYTNSVRDAIPDNVTMLTYADDSKIVSSAADDAGCENLQNAINKFYEWSTRLDLRLSVNKCKILHFGRNNRRHAYFIHDTRIEVANVVTDLGVEISDDFKFTEHVRKAVLNATRTSNWILRALILREPETYIRLFDTYVLSKMLYAAPVWRPQHKKDIKLLQTVCNRFRSRVAFRCHVPKYSVPLVDINDRLDLCDTRLLDKIVNYLPDICDKLFDHGTSSSRLRNTVRSKFIPRKDLVNNLFPFRSTRLSRQIPFMQ